MKFLKWTFVFFILISVLGVIFIANSKVEENTNGNVFYNIDKLPVNKVGLLLGTSKLLQSGKPNQYFQNRIDATVTLFNKNKIRYVVISGDNSRKNYNEPQDMKDELVKAGISENKIFLDYAGFRTFDSVYRMNQIFGQQSFTIISQEFHNRRAIYIAKTLNLNACGFNAKDVNVYNGFKTKMREKFARVKMFFDFIFGQKPKYLGEKIIIN